MIHVYSERRDGVWFTIAVNENRQLVACNFSDEGRQEAERAVKKLIPKDQPVSHDQPQGMEVKAVMEDVYDAYRGNWRRPRNFDFLANVSSFRRKVYGQLCSIPRGRVTTYGAIAKNLGSTRYSRAVGTAVATNPISLMVPCHRVVPSSLRVGNYGMPGRHPTEGGPVKHAILEREGVKFVQDKVSKHCLWSPN